MSSVTSPEYLWESAGNQGRPFLALWLEDTCFYRSRQACSDAAVHPGILAGIYGRKDTGAFSVALSGGYEDDVDYGYKLYVIRSF